MEKKVENKKATIVKYVFFNELEKNLIIEAMEKTQDNQTKAAEILGISERMLRYKLKKYGLKS